MGSSSTETKDAPVVVGICGASGSMLAEPVIDRLLELAVPVAVAVSGPAEAVWEKEMAEPFPVAVERWSKRPGFSLHGISDFFSPVASGTYPTTGMVVVPCSMATLASIAVGLADNLIRRAADVCLKERRPLVLVPRETPLSAIQLEHMASLSRLGATILPPEPAFYLHPKTIDDVVAYIAERVLNALGVTDRLPEEFQYRG